MSKLFKFLFNMIASIIGADCDWRREAVDEGILDFSGQGRDRYGH